MIYHAEGFIYESEADLEAAIIDMHNQAVKKLPTPDPLRPRQYKFLVIDVEPIRSVPANNYYWLLLTALEDITGHEKYELHRIFAKLFNMELKETSEKEIMVARGSTSKAKEKYFWQYLEKIRQFAMTFMGVTQDDFDKHIPPRDRITEEDLINMGIVDYTQK